MKGMLPDSEPIGESWEVSAVPGSESVVANGTLAGRTLSELCREYGPLLVGEKVSERYGDKFPLLVKFIDAQRDLSIQVHPNDRMAMECHGKFGKSEMWYIMDARPGACLYAGMKESITPEEYRRRVADGTICDVLARHEVHAGDVFYIPAGRVHAICGGILLAEVQQSSDITYRIFDYNRPGLDGRPRELHTELAAEAIDYNVEADYRTRYPQPQDRARLIVDSPYFSVRVIDVTTPFHRNMLKYDSFVISMCLEGACTIRTRRDGTSVHVEGGNSVLIPACVADYDIIPDEGSASAVRILEAFIDNKDRSLASQVTRFLHLSDR